MFIEQIFILLFISLLFFNFIDDYHPAATIETEQAFELRYRWLADTMVFDSEYLFYREYFGPKTHKKVVFAGDSLSRRLAYTFASFLMGKTSTAELKRDPTGAHRQFNNIYGSNISFHWSPCVSQGIEFFKKNEQKYDLFIFSHGVHYVAPSGQCIKNNFYEEFDELKQIKNKSKIIYRTQPMSSRVEAQRDLLDFVEYSLNQTSDLTMLDHFDVLKERSYGVSRISGNSKDHFGVQARLALAIHTFESIQDSLF